MDSDSLSPKQLALKIARHKSRARRTHGVCDCGQPGTRRGAEYVCQRCRDLECLHFQRASNSPNGKSKYPRWEKYVAPYHVAASWSMEIV